MTMADLDRLTREVRHNFPRKRIWLTEYGYQTNPPDRWLGVSAARQALYASAASLRAYGAARRHAHPLHRPGRRPARRLAERVGRSYSIYLQIQRMRGRLSLCAVRDPAASGRQLERHALPRPEAEPDRRCSRSCNER
jgi:hypothetical protein